MTRSKTFDSLPLQRKELNASANRYRVYKDKTEFVVVEAANAHEALKASGLAVAQRIERDSIYFHTVIDLEAMAKTPSPAAATAQAAAEAPKETVFLDPPPAAAPAAATAPAEAPPAAPPAAEAPPAAPLSAGEVDKLLQG